MPSITTLALFGSRSAGWPVSVDALEARAGRRAADRAGREPIGFATSLGSAWTSSQRAAEADDAGDVLGPGAPLPFLRPALDAAAAAASPVARRARRRPSARRACAPRGSRRSACQASTSSGSRAAGLDRVGVEARLARPRRSRRSRRSAGSVPTSLLASMTLTSVVRSVMRGRDVGRVDAAVSVHRQVGHLEAAAAPGWRTRAGPPCARRAVVTTWRPRAAGRPGDALDGEVVGLGAAAGEDDLARLGADAAAATVSRASSSPWRARRPAACRLDGLP